MKAHLSTVPPVGAHLPPFVSGILGAACPGTLARRVRGLRPPGHYTCAASPVQKSHRKYVGNPEHSRGILANVFGARSALLQAVVSVIAVSRFCAQRNTFRAQPISVAAAVFG